MKISAAVLAFFLATVISHAQFINWLGDYNITGDSDVFTDGAYVDAFQAPTGGYNGRTTAATVVNGVTFNINDTGSHSDGTFSLGGVSDGTDGDYPYVGSTAYKSVLADCAYTFGTGTVSISGLTNGQEYEIQIWNATPYDPTDYVGSSSSDSIYGARGTYVLGKFFAIGTTASFNFAQPSAVEGGGSGASVISAIEIRAVPEPSTYGALALGVLALAGVVRVRKLAA